MKRLVLLASLNALAFAGLSQHTLQASLVGTDRMAMVKNSISLPVWHEKSYWDLYDKYLLNHEPVASLSYRALNDLANADKSIEAQQALENAKNMIACRNNELALRAKYYGEVGNGFNGVIALQFLQTESLIEMMEASQIYETTNWRNFRFHPKVMSPSQYRTAKYNTITTALALTSENSEAFFAVYSRYEEECDELLGEDYNIYGLFSVEASDYPPGVAKRLGHNLIHLMQREAKLKEKYFYEMDKAVGASVAARFLAWEDYYSCISKMYAWAEQ